MRSLRACLLLVLLTAGTAAAGGAVVGPVRDGWAAVAVAGAPRATAAGGEVTALVTGCCAVLAGLAWVWLVAAVGACTWDALRGGRTAGNGRAPGLLRPRLVRVAVATCLGATSLAGPAAQARSAVVHVQTLPNDLAALPAAAVTPRLLDGLPVPHRTSGSARPSRAAPGDAPGVAQDHRAASAAEAPRASPLPRRLEVVPGDSLWSLTAGLLPAGSPVETVASGWRLLYAANRGVVGADPDLLQPGQTLRISPALTALVAAVSADRGARHDESRPHDAGGSR